VRRRHSRQEVRVLVLTRKEGEAIRVGDEVRVVVVEIRGNQVKLGIEAPQSVVVDREERVDDEKEEGDGGG